MVFSTRCCLRTMPALHQTDEQQSYLDLIRDPVKLPGTISSIPTGSVPRFHVRYVGYLRNCAETIGLGTSCVTPRRESSRGFALDQWPGNGSTFRCTSSIHTRPLPCTTRFSRIRSGFCPASRKKGVTAVIQLMVPVTGRSNPREKNSPLPGIRTHISKKAFPSRPCVCKLAWYSKVAFSMLTSVTSNSGTVIAWFASTRNEPFPSVDTFGSKLTPLVARTPSRLSRGKCFNSTGDGACPELVQALIASTTSKTRNVFMVAPRRLDTLPVVALRCVVDDHILCGNPSHERVPFDTTGSCDAISEVNREEGRGGVRNVARPATVRLRPNPRQRKR